MAWLGDQLENLAFANGERGDVVDIGRSEVIVQDVLHFGREEGAMPFEGLHRVDEVVGGIGFEDKTTSSGAQDFPDEPLGIVNGENEDALVAVVLEDFASGVEPVDAGHAYIENDDVRVEFYCHLNSLQAVGSLAAHRPRGLLLQDGTDSTAYQLVVIGNKNPQWHGSPSEWKVNANRIARPVHFRFAK